MIKQQRRWSSGTLVSKNKTYCFSYSNLNTDVPENLDSIFLALHTSGGYSEKVTPVPIPNTVVKLLCADNTWRATSREHKSLPERKTLALLVSNDSEI